MGRDIHSNDITFFPARSRKGNGEQVTNKMLADSDNLITDMEKRNRFGRGWEREREGGDGISLSLLNLSLTPTPTKPESRLSFLACA